MDIILMLSLVLTTTLMLRDASTKYILASWLATSLMIVGLFNLHVTSSLGLSF